jgi:RimJ/RimL family protein N-acetyltransferase
LDLDKISPKVIGEKIMLGPLRADMNDTYRRWLHNPHVSYMLRPNALYTHEQENDWMAASLKSGNVHFTIYEKETGTPIGCCGLMEIDDINRTAEFGIFIGEENNKNKGLGTEAVLLTVDYGFNIMNLSSVFLRVHANNMRALKVYERVGFKKIGIRRRGQFLGGIYHDDLFMDILPDELKFSRTKELLKQVEEKTA